MRRLSLFSTACLAMAGLTVSPLLDTGLDLESGAVFDTQAQAAAKGPSGLPLPRFVSLKAKRVNLRVGPGQNYAVAWLYTKAGVPMEVIQEYDNWRRVRDAEGTEGWVYQSLLSGERTAVTAPWKMGEAKDEFIDMLWTMAHYEDGPIAVRYPRGAGIGAKPKNEPHLLEIGKGELVHDGQDVALIGLGFVHDLAVEARRQLEDQGYSVALLNPRFIKPLDTELILDVARRCKVICTFEDHVLKNGFGASIIELLHEQGIDTPVERVGWPGEFVRHLFLHL